MPRKLGKILQDGRPVVQELKMPIRNILSPCIEHEKRDYQEENDLHRWAEQCSGTSQRNLPGGSTAGGTRHWP